jgi:hypothetical protein
VSLKREVGGARDWELWIRVVDGILRDHPQLLSLLLFIVKGDSQRKIRTASKLYRTIKIL